MFLFPSPLGLKRRAEKPPERPQPLIQCAHMVGSSKEETSSSPGAVRVLEPSSCSLLSYITRRMQRGWKEWESRANEGKQKCGWRRFALVQVGWMTGQKSPSSPTKLGCPPQAASHRGWSWVRWGTGRPLWFGFLGIKRQNCFVREMQNKPETSTSCKQHFVFFHKLATWSLVYFSILISAFSLIFRLSFFFTQM